MAIKKHDRQYDLVVLGATGYTGALTATHIAANLSPGLRWAVAGRSEEKLKALVAECQALDTSRAPPAIEVCNVDDDELGVLARKAFCLITTLGPYTHYGEHTFRACAEAGTHYIDCTGEVTFTMSMIQKYEETAKKSGAWMFPQSGLESAPSDLLTWALVSTLRSKLSAQTGDVVLNLHRLDSMPTGGTLSSLLTMIEMNPAKVILQALKPYALSPVPNHHPAPKKSLLSSATGVVRMPGLGVMSTSLTGAMNSAAVWRAWGLSKQERGSQIQFYGPHFTYREYMKAPNVVAGTLIHYGLLSSAPLLLCPLVRGSIRKLTFKPGDGPDKEQAKKDLIELRAIAKPDTPGETKKQAFGRFAYTGSMYYLTAVILAQAATTILEDSSVELGGGIYTVSCLGQGLVDRIVEAGVHLETEIQEL